MRESCLVSFSIKPLTSFPHIFLKGRIDVQIAPTGLELMSTHCLSNVMFGYGSMRSCIYVNLNLCMCVHILQERKSSKQILLSKKITTCLWWHPSAFSGCKLCFSTNHLFLCRSHTDFLPTAILHVGKWVQACWIIYIKSQWHTLQVRVSDPKVSYQNYSQGQLHHQKNNSF